MSKRKKINENMNKKQFPSPHLNQTMTFLDGIKIKSLKAQCTPCIIVIDIHTIDVLRTFLSNL